MHKPGKKLRSFVRQSLPRTYLFSSKATRNHLMCLTTQKALRPVYFNAKVNELMGFKAS